MDAGVTDENKTNAQEEADRTNRAAGCFRFIWMLVLVVVLTFGLRTFLFQPYEIPSGSMEETIMPGDMVFSEKVSYYFREPAQGDIVTFQDTQMDNRVLIKRCIAVGGQTVDLKNGVVYVDGVPLSEPYTKGMPSNPLNSKITYPYVVPEGYIWVMGDNRLSSADSRVFGAVPVENVNGRAFFTYWPIDSIGLLE